MDLVYHGWNYKFLQALLDVIRNAWVNLNSFDFGMEGVGRLLKPELAFA